MGSEILGARHWGIYVGNGYVVSKFGDGTIAAQHLEEKPWIGFTVKHYCSYYGTGVPNQKIAEEAIRRYALNKKESYDLQTAN